MAARARKRPAATGQGGRRRGAARSRRARRRSASRPGTSTAADGTAGAEAELARVHDDAAAVAERYNRLQSQAMRFYG